VEVRDMICIEQKDNLGDETLQSEFRKIALDLRWVSSQAELNEILTKVNVLKTKEQLKVVKSDKILIHAVSVLDEVEKNINILSEHLREWYGLYFPEAVKLMTTNEKLADLVTKYGKRDTIRKEYSGEPKNLPKYAENSAGMDFSEIDISTIQGFSKSIVNLFELKENLSDYIKKSAQEVIPNMSVIVGQIMAARMLAAAGSLEKLARMPSSTVQLLGAEKALFRHLKGEGKAPKYGILFGEVHIQNAPKELKGKVARLVASKLSLAAKTDFYSDIDRTEMYKKQFEDQLKRILKS
ncbi:MAG: NOP5/NOP56 family protein, partial [Candidatus Aenigmatarchaeota archaeon]